MNREEINEQIDGANNTTSIEVNASGLLSYSRKAANTTMMAQVIRVPAAGNYEVVLECGVISTDGLYEYGTIGEFTQDDDKRPSVFHTALNCKLRFRHVSGAQVRVKLRH